MTNQTPQPASSLDISALMAEIRQRVEQKQAAGEYADLEEILQKPLYLGGEDEVSFHLGKMHRHFVVELDRPIASSVPGIASLVIRFKTLFRRLLKWHTRDFIDQINPYHYHTLMVMQGLVERHESLHRHLQTQLELESSRLRMEIHRDRVRHDEELEALRYQSSDLQVRVEELEQQRLSARLRRVERERSQEPPLTASIPQTAPQTTPGPPQTEAVSSKGPMKHFDNYCFEERHRGSFEAIVQRQQRYLPYFKKSPGPVIDGGCGRGEFLQLLKEEGAEVLGVDFDPDMVAACKERGLTAQEGDIVEVLKAREDESLGGLFLSHIVEHLAPERLIELIDLAGQKLARGGTFVAETPNSLCLSVAASSFWIDPTHVRPVHPEALHFWLASSGFAKPELLFLSPFPSEHGLQNLPGDSPSFTNDERDLYNENVKRLNGLLYGFQDYAVVAKKL